MALPAFQWDRTTQCCRTFTLALARLSCQLFWSMTVAKLSNWASWIVDWVYTFTYKCSPSCSLTVTPSGLMLACTASLVASLCTPDVLCSPSFKHTRFTIVLYIISRTRPTFSCLECTNGSITSLQTTVADNCHRRALVLGDVRGRRNPTRLRQCPARAIPLQTLQNEWTLYL